MAHKSQLTQAEFEEFFMPLQEKAKEPYFREVSFIGRKYYSDEHVFCVTAYMFDMSLLMDVFSMLRSRRCDYITVEPYVLGEDNMPY